VADFWDDNPFMVINGDIVLKHEVFFASPASLR